MLSHPALRLGSAGGYLAAKVTGFGCARARAPDCALDSTARDAADATALDAAATAWSRTGKVAPMFAIALPSQIALAEGLGSWRSPSALDTGQLGFWALSLATFACCSTATAVRRAAAALAAVLLLEATPTAVCPFGFGNITAAPGDPACGVCQPLCLGGLDTKFIPGGACHAVPCGKLLVLITAGGAGGRTFAASGEPWMLPAMAAAVTAW